MIKKCLQISDNDIIGNRFNGYDLGKYLRHENIECNYLVWRKDSDDNSVYEISANDEDRQTVHEFGLKLNHEYSTQASFFPFSYDVLSDPKFLEADVIHLHLIHNYFFNLSDLPVMSALKPVIWTLHDPWALTGHCVHPMECDSWKTGCGDCPDLETTFPILNDTTALNWLKKKQIYQNSDLDIIVASRWMHDRVSASPLFSKARLHHIPFGLDLSKFKPEDCAAIKERLGIPEKNIVICFRATESAWKGLRNIKECLHEFEITKDITILTFNETGLVDEFKHKFQIIELGWVSDDTEMINAYNASDVFLMPSTADAFGMMAMEAMCCGKTVVTMAGTGLEEVVMADQGGGIVVPQGDVNAMRCELTDLVQNKRRRREIEKKAYQLSRRYYDKNRYVSQIIDIYSKAAERRTNQCNSFVVNQIKKYGRLKGDLEKEDGYLFKGITKREYAFLLKIRNFRKNLFIRSIERKLKAIINKIKKYE